MSSPRTRTIVRFVAPRTVDVATDSIPPPDAGEVQVTTEVSAISPGTEMLVYRGEAPSTLDADPSIDSLEGGLDFPLSYGYAAVGRVTALGEAVDPGWDGKRVFSFQPHASRFNASVEALVPIPDAVSNAAAALIPSVETAVTLAMDGRPMVGERVAVFGQGVIGLLTTTLLAQYPLDCLLTLDPLSTRRSHSRNCGADAALDPETERDTLYSRLQLSQAEAQDAAEGPYEGADLVYELSGRPEVLNQALDIAGFDGRVVVGSWYGTKNAPLDLGGRFHRSRIEVSSSQVSSIAPAYRGRWSKARRLDQVVQLLPELQPERLVTHEVPAEEASSLYRMLDEGDGEVLQPLIQYR